MSAPTIYDINVFHVGAHFSVRPVCENLRLT